MIGRSRTTKIPESKRESLVSKIRRTDFPQSLNSPVNHIFCLQRTFGNQVVQRMFKSCIVKAKLNVGLPGDKYEQEADKVTDQVLRMPESQLQRQPEEEEKKEEEYLQAKGNTDQISEVTSDLESRIQSLRGVGQPLSKSVRNYFEPRFGYDFSQVRVHTDAQAHYLARAMNAKAFTAGRDVVFGAGQYSPGTKKGINLLAHEMTHVVQQKGGSIIPYSISLRQFRESPVQSHVPIQMTGRKTIQFKRKDEEAVFDLVNKKRGDNLKWSGKLYNSARKHSKWMYRSKKLKHTSKLIVKGFDLVGENIGRGFKKNSDVVKDWWNSPPHKANIVRSQFEEAAVGIVGKGVARYFTQHFGAVRPRAEFWKDSKQKGDEWTHIIKGKVSDNIDSAAKISISIGKVKGEFKSLPSRTTSDDKGNVTIEIITKGSETAKIEIKVTDSHGNFQKIQVDL